MIRIAGKSLTKSMIALLTISVAVGAPLAVAAVGTHSHQTKARSTQGYQPSRTHRPLIATPAPPTPSAAELADLRAISVRFAAGVGESHPTDGTVFESSRQIAAQVAMEGARVDTDRSVYVVTLHGDFVANDVPTYSAETIPRGHVLLLVIDAGTNEITDWGIVQTNPNTSLLSAGTALG